MRSTAIAIAAFFSATSTATALPDNFLEPASSVVLKAGRLQIKSADMATVNFSVANKTDKPLLAVAVTCTALVNDEPVETNSNPVQGIGPSEKAYAAINFFEVKGRQNATVSCRVEWVRLR